MLKKECDYYLTLFFHYEALNRFSEVTFADHDAE